MATIPDDLRRQLEHAGIPIATSCDGYVRQLAVYGRSALWLPYDAQTEDASSLTATDVAERIATMCAWFAAVLPAPTVDPAVSPLSGSGYYGQSCPREIPDTPLDEWTAGVEALLDEYEQCGCAKPEDTNHDTAATR